MRLSLVLILVAASASAQILACTAREICADRRCRAGHLGFTLNLAPARPILTLRQDQVRLDLLETSDLAPDPRGTLRRYAGLLGARTLLFDLYSGALTSFRMQLPGPLRSDPPILHIGTCAPA